MMSTHSTTPTRRVHLESAAILILLLAAVGISGGLMVLGMHALRHQHLVSINLLDGTIYGALMLAIVVGIFRAPALALFACVLLVSAQI